MGRGTQTSERQGRSRLFQKRSATVVGVGLALIALLVTGAGCSASHPSDSVVPAANTGVITPSVSTPTVTTKTVTETTSIPFTSTTVENSALAQGTSTVTTAGVNGVQTTTYKVTYTDGTETAREQLSQVVTTAPVTQVTTVGTAVPPPAANNGGSSNSNSNSNSNDHNGATALCKDGTLSYSAHHQGTCSHHGGVAQWYK